MATFIKQPRYFIASLLLGFVVLLADQASKWWVLEVLALPQRPPIEITSFFNLVMVWNHGVSFGMFSDQRMPWVLSILACVIIVILLRWLARNTSLVTGMAIGCVIGGAVGNVIDRVRFGAVVDFLDFYWQRYHWPAFNVADSAICIGVVVLCIQSMIHPESAASKDENV